MSKILRFSWELFALSLIGSGFGLLIFKFIGG